MQSYSNKSAHQFNRAHQFVFAHQSLSNIEKELDDLADNINQGVKERYIDTVPAIGPDQWMTE